jgi:hypothetical protein
MLSRSNIDDVGYNQLLASAYESLPRYCPQWTDYNAHDPGIMLVELICYLTENQRYYAQATETATALLWLLGIQPLPAFPSRAHASIVRDVDGIADPLVIPQGTPLYAEDVRFETVHPFTYGDKHRILELANEDTIIKIGELTLFYPFGLHPQPGKSFSLFLESPPLPGRTFSLEVALSYPSGFVRNPVDEANPPHLAHLVWEQRTAEGYQVVKVRDATFGLLCDGIVHLNIEEAIEPDGEGRYELRCRLTWCDYDVVPCIRGLQPTVIIAEQRHTIVEDMNCGTDHKQLRPDTWLGAVGDRLVFWEHDGRYTRVDARKAPRSLTKGGGSYHVLSWQPEDASRRIVGEAYGFPSSRFRLTAKGESVIPESLEILVADGPDLAHAERWQATDNLLAAGPTSRHYLLDAPNGEIVFGDGVHGAMPKGVILAASLVVTQGLAGNITTDQLRELSFAGRCLLLSQPQPSAGGRDGESIQAAVQRWIQARGGSVTAADIENLVHNIPGLAINRVRAYRKHQIDRRTAPTVCVAVQPTGTQEPLLTVSYARQIRAYLEPYRLAASEFEVIGVCYARIDVTVEVVPMIEGGLSPAAIEGKIGGFFAARADFGAELNQGELVQAIEDHGAVRRVTRATLRSTSIHASRGLAGAIKLDENAIAVVGTLSVSIR